jgi:phosphatidylinositol alpha-1,6-mannosyltransferase
MAPLAALAARQASATLVVQLHGIEIWPEPTPAQRRALEAADLLLCVSRDTRARALTHCDLPPERAVVVNNTVDPRFKPGDRGAARSRFGLRDEFVLLIVGRLDARERYKGHNRVLAALASLTHPEGRPVVFLIAGGGDDRGRLEAEAAVQGVTDRVRFLGHISGADLPDLYRAADLFVLPSTGEGFGIAFLEAMACGTPAMGLAQGGAPDALADGALGWCGGEEEFPGALREALARKPPGVDEAEALSHNTRQRFGQAALLKRVADIAVLLKEFTRLPLERKVRYGW